MPKVTEEHTEARRRQILAAALACFAREGFHRATMQDLFRQAELSPGAVYSYFKGKDDLIEAIVGAALSFLGSLAETLREPGPQGRLRTPGEAVVFMVSAFRDFDLGHFDERVRIFPQLIAEAQRRPHIGDRVRDSLGGALSVLADLVRAAQQRGELSPELDPEAVGRLALAALHGFLIQRGLFGEAMDQEAYLANASAVLDGISPVTGRAGPVSARP